MRLGWRPIADFEADPKTLTDGELESLSRVWADQKAELSEEGTLDEFDKRLRREWSIETGIIENVYTLDRGVTKTLIEKGINAALIPQDASNRDSVVVARIIQDHYDALEGLFDFVSGQRQLSTGYIKELHAALLRNQDVYAVVDQFGKVFEKPLDKGLYKTLPNNPTRLDGTVHEYCPPEHVASEMDRLVAMHAEHEAGGVPVEVEAAWLHHRFTQIHPFADGNGRVARAIASLVLIKAGWLPLIVQREGRARYIEALEMADGGDLMPLVSMVTESQKNALMEAAHVAWDIAFRLMRVTEERFGQIAQQLKHASGVPARVLRIEETLEREKNFNVQLVLKETSDTLELSFRQAGPRYRGRIEAVPCLYRGTTPSLVEAAPFLIHPAESYEHAQARFSAWLERIIVAGLNQWRLTL